MCLFVSEINNVLTTKKFIIEKKFKLLKFLIFMFLSISFAFNYLLYFLLT